MKLFKRSETEHPEPPEAPENVRIVRPDGTEIPLEVFYLGIITGDDGFPMHEWEAITEVMPQMPQDHIRIGVLPARTEVKLTFRGPDGR